VIKKAIHTYVLPCASSTEAVATCGKGSERLTILAQGWADTVRLLSATAAETTIVVVAEVIPESSCTEFYQSL